MDTASLGSMNGKLVLNRNVLGDTLEIGSYEEYKKALFALKLEDNKDSFDRTEPELNQSERKLDAYMNARRDAMIKDKYVYFQYPPANLFYKVRAQIENDPLLKLFGFMPKGGNLHIHTSATLNATKFVNMLRTQPAIKDHIVIYIGQDMQKYCQLYFINDPKLVDNAKGFYFLNDAIGRGRITESTLVSMLSMSDNRIDKVDYIWDEFNAIFSRVSPVMKTRTVFAQYYQNALLDLAEDNIDYAEIRFGPGTLVDCNDNLLANDLLCENVLQVTFPPDDDTESIMLFREAYYQVRRTYKDFKVKLILSGSRKKVEGQTEEQAVAIAVDDMRKTQVWKQQIKDVIAPDGQVEFIIGYDLVSEEDRGYPTEAYAKAIFDNNITTPFYFHDGESSWADSDNLYAAYLLGTKRVGHGLNLFRFPAVMQNVKDNNVALEVCPISNQLLRYTPDLRMHPIGEFLKRGVQCVICSDDPQIFNYSGLRYDFLEAYYSLLIDLRALKKLIKNSYVYSGMEAKREATGKLEAWQYKWDAFVIQMLTLIEEE